MDPSTLLAIVLALIGGGGVGLYTARPKKDSIIADASQTAVAVVESAMERLEEEVRGAHERVAMLEGQLGKEMAKTIKLRKQHDALVAEVRRLGGDPQRVLGNAA